MWHTDVMSDAARIAKGLEALLARCTADIDALRDLKVGSSPSEAAVADMILEANHGMADTLHHMRTVLAAEAGAPQSKTSPRRRRAA